MEATCKRQMGSLEGELVYADVVEQIKFYYRTGEFVLDYLPHGARNEKG